MLSKTRQVLRDDLPGRRCRRGSVRTTPARRSATARRSCHISPWPDRLALDLGIIPEHRPRHRRRQAEVDGVAEIVADEAEAQVHAILARPALNRVVPTLHQAGRAVPGPPTVPTRRRPRPQSTRPPCRNAVSDSSLKPRYRFDLPLPLAPVTSVQRLERQKRDREANGNSPLASVCNTARSAYCCRAGAPSERQSHLVRVQLGPGEARTGLVDRCRSRGRHRRRRARHSGRPSPFGSPDFAKFTQ